MTKKKSKSKKEKKSKKDRKKRSKRASESDVPDDVSAGQGEGNTIPIQLSAGAEQNGSAVGGGWSWGSAFAAASEVQPDEDLDEDVPPGGGGEGVMGISQLAMNHTKRASNVGTNIERAALKRKRSGSMSDDDDLASDDDASLEGRMVPFNGDMSLVLVDKQSGKVYSSTERTDDGNRLVIGKIAKGKVELDPDAAKQTKRPEEGDAAGPSFPYPTNPDDHCETPLQSYKDILPVLNELCKSFGGGKQSLGIYDPYFCDGSVVQHLASLGFTNVYNQKEDCYAVWRANAGPKFDVLLTNPPYSEDHIEKMMKHITSPSFRHPWLLLMPQWVHKKDYYVNATTKNRERPCNPFYIVPKKRYVYLPPANFREKKESDTHKKSSPFVSMWYCCGGTEQRNRQLIDAFRRSASAVDCDLARSKSALRDLRRSGSGKSSKKKKKARK
ncbi:hypothetical protein ACHAXT_002504 [Thalassiosira profunda]